MSVRQFCWCLSAHCVPEVPPVTTQWGIHAASNGLLSVAVEGPALMLWVSILVASGVLMQARFKFQEWNILRVCALNPQKKIDQKWNQTRTVSEKVNSDDDRRDLYQTGFKTNCGGEGKLYFKYLWGAIILAYFERVDGHIAHKDKFIVLVEGVVLQWRYNAWLSNYKFHKFANSNSRVARNLSLS